MAGKTFAPAGGLYRGWWVAFVSAGALAFSYPSVLIMTFGVLLPEWTANGGWTAGAVGLAISASTVAAIIGAPLVGRLLDRFGPRQIILISTAASGVTLLVGSYIARDLWQLCLVFFAVTLVGSGAAPMAYSRLILNWFNVRKGLALGVMLAGVGVGAMVCPLIAQSALANGHDWRFAYSVFAAIILVIWLPVQFAWLHESPTSEEADRVGEWPAQPLAAAEATEPNQISPKSQPEFWLILLFFLLTGFVLTGMIGHFVPMLREHDISANGAAAILSSMGLAMIAGRLLCGWLMDRVPPPRVAALFMAGPLLCVALFLTVVDDGPTAIIATILFGFGTGAEMAILAVLIRSHFPLGVFGTIYGTTFAVFNLGSGLGVPTIGYLADHAGSYTFAMTLAAALLLVAIAATFGLKPLSAQPLSGAKSAT